MSSSASSSYSKLDRILHNVAFDSTSLQDILADIEGGLFAREWQEIVVEKPIFITSLPRAGTTIVLETLYRVSNLATHTYRDMPFILTPIIWHKVSRLFRQSSQSKERAHGDGIAINEDSPEAFEEVLWKKHFPAQYSHRGIACWSDSLAKETFEQLFRAHMQKIISLRRIDKSDELRYVSKNNANIARIAYIRALFPDAQFVVPLRHPVEHAISLLRQHDNFARQHAEDVFARKYMADIGHYEFGQLHRAILFPGVEEWDKNLTPDTLDYWIRYWIAAFSYLSRHDNLCFLGYESFCQRPVSCLQGLLEYLELSASEEAVQQAAEAIRSPTSRWQDDYTADPSLVEQALDCYQSLQHRCLAAN